MTRRERYWVHSQAAPGEPDEGQRACARGDWCAALTRDDDGAWRPARTYQPFCPACTSRIIACLAELPQMYGLIAATMGDPLRAGRVKVRAPPGPRVLVSPPADALLREAAPLLGGWAARVRAVPGLSLTAPPDAIGSPLRVRADCLTLAIHAGPLLALPHGWTSRTYDVPGTAPLTLDRTHATCRACARLITRSPVSGWWWAPNGQPAAFCDHDPAPGSVTTARERPVPESARNLLEDIADDEILHAGDGWVTVFRKRDGADAGTEILDLHWRARKLAGHVPAPPETLDGLPCRECEAMGALALIEQPPPDPQKPEPPCTRCLACHDEMTRKELDQWAQRYEAWAKGQGFLTCRRCELSKHADCFWDACGCAAAGHSAALRRGAA